MKLKIGNLYKLLADKKMPTKNYDKIMDYIATEIEIESNHLRYVIFLSHMDEYHSEVLDQNGRKQIIVDGNYYFEEIKC